jgi:hypothetical protein
LVSVSIYFCSQIVDAIAKIEDLSPLASYIDHHKGESNTKVKYFILLGTM